MLYPIIKIVARISIYFYCRDVYINNKKLLQHKGPLLLAVNHPNSFLDAIILCTLFKQPVHSLARGDVFKSRLAASILYKLKILPVYRVSEGAENLEENYKTFDACKKIFKQNGIVLIFSEGLCINEWHLRTLKKGTARLAISCWNDGIDLKVLPVGINYHSFKSFGKNVKLFLGEFITQNEVATNCSDGHTIKAFNDNLKNQLAPFVFEIAETDKEKLRKHFYIHQPLFKKILLAIPAVAGFIIHAPLYYPLAFINKKIFKDLGHYDSVMVGFGLLFYPAYTLLLTILLFWLWGCWYAFLLPIVFLFTAWAYLQLKNQFD